MNNFKVGDELYYVNPFVFIIEKVLIEFIDEDNEAGIVFYIDHSGAMLAEHDLFKTLGAAQQMAVCRLNDFYAMKLHEIAYSNPELDFDQED